MFCDGDIDCYFDVASSLRIKHPVKRHHRKLPFDPDVLVSWGGNT